MTRIDFDWVDAFTDTPFKGNGCAVVYDGGAWDDETCINYTRETGLTECTFIAPSKVADVRVRYFLASGEIPFAGHPTIATAISLFDRGQIGVSARFETGAGNIAIEIKDGWVKMQQKVPQFGQMLAGNEIAEIYGLRAVDITAPPQMVSTGLPFVITLLKNRAALDSAKLNAKKLQAFQKRRQFAGFCEPYLCVIEERGTTARLLMPPPNPAEDPFTGSASGAMAAFLWHHGHINTAAFDHFQGHKLGREGMAKLECIGTPDDISGVLVSGQGYVLKRGSINL